MAVGDVFAYTEDDIARAVDSITQDLRQELAASRQRVVKLEGALRTGRDAIGVMVEVIIKCFLETSESPVDKEAGEKVLARIVAAKPVMDAALAEEEPVPPCDLCGATGSCEHYLETGRNAGKNK